MSDLGLLREFHRRFVTGVTIVATRDRNGEPRGLVVNAFSSLSLDPPLVMVCIARTSSSSPALFQAEHFSVNLLGTGQLPLVDLFSKPNTDRFSGDHWVDAPHGSPILRSAPGSLEALVVERLVGHSHTVFIGQVESVSVGDERPLLYAYSRIHDDGQLHHMP